MSLAPPPFHCGQLSLAAQIHVDDYKMRIYQSLAARTSDDKLCSSSYLTPESPALVGYMCGNAPHPGCLTSDPNVRLHSCEKGNLCNVAKGPSVVRIHPIIAHLPSGADLTEVGVGGGGGDLEREAELDLASQEDLLALIEKYHDDSD
jgi:DNA cross-link repair 1C protein